MTTHSDIQQRRVIEALKFVRVEVKKGHLTDISIAMLLVELERRGVSFTPSNGVAGV